MLKSQRLKFFPSHIIAGKTGTLFPKSCFDSTFPKHSTNASGIIAGFIATRVENILIVEAGFCSITLIGTYSLAFMKSAYSWPADYYIFAFYAIRKVTITALVISDAAEHTKKVTTSEIFLMSYHIGNVIKL